LVVEMFRGKGLVTRSLVIWPDSEDEQSCFPPFPSQQKEWRP
jgi:hypothetical protein